MKKILQLISVCLLLTANCFSQAGEWTWMKGDIVPNSAGVFGTKGIASSLNTPPALYGAALWLDDSNNIWLFGGVSFNTLWKYNISTNEWTWMNGTTFNSSPGVYGTLGVPSPANTPGARGFGFLSWKDLNGDFWIYGGNGYDKFGNEGLLSDLWKYSVATNEWTWMSGSNSAFPSQPTNYGTLQVASPTNTPGGREETTANWVDADGNFWFFGGFNNNIATKDDVWKYDIALNQWIWMAGSQSEFPITVYGTIGVSSPLNTPGGRNSYSAWKDLSGNFWLYGGAIMGGGCADLWKFDLSNLQWTWMSGSNVLNNSGNSGDECLSDTSFYPTSRSENRACWKDLCGNFWMFGGTDYHNDLWVYRPNFNDWTFASGSLISNAVASYGTQGVSSPSNIPGGRFGAPAIYDTSGNAWVFGGNFPNGNKGNDLWRFVQDTTCPSLPNCSAFQFPSFDASQTKVCQKFCTDFNDQSNNNPLAWQWFFEGGSPDVSSNQNPSNICYAVPGVYDVTLITTNAFGNDTLTLSNYITVYATPPIPTITQNGYTLTSSSASFYQWQLDAFDIAGATNQSYTILQSGLYTVIVSDSNGCVNSASQYVLISGINESENESEVLIYPNPSNGIFVVELLNGLMPAPTSSGAGEISLSVFNLLGQKVFSVNEIILSSNKKEINLTTLADGVYFIQLSEWIPSGKMQYSIVRKKIVIVR